MKTLFTAILGACLLLSTSAFAEIKVGDTEEKVRLETPDYIGEFNRGNSKVLYFKKGEVVITGGKVSKISWIQTKKKITKLSGIIKDPAVDRAIRKKIRKSSGKLTNKNLESLRVLTIDTRTKGRLRANNLFGLEKAANLYELRLGNNSLTNVSSLSGLVNLRDLYFHGGTGVKGQASAITDFSWIGGMKNLRALYLNSHDISDLSPLAKLSKLRELTLINCGVSDLSVLAPLSGSLQKLVLSGNSIDDVTNLVGLENVSVLYLDGNQISDLSPLGQIGGLGGLVLDGNPIMDIAPLMTLPKLKTLSIMNTRLSTAADSEARAQVDALRARGVAVRFPPAPKPAPAPEPKEEGDAEPASDSAK